MRRIHPILRPLAIAGAIVAAGTLLTSHSSADGVQIPVVLGFDEMSGMTSITRHDVPPTAKVSTNYLSRYGVVFRSTVDYVAVVHLGKRDAITPPNGIGGVGADSKLSYDAKNPIYIGFFDRTGTGTPAVTDFVSVRCDQDGSGKQVHIVAYDVNGAVIAEDAKADSDGATLSVHAPGIHSVTFFGTTDDDGAALDDVTFDPVTAPVAAPTTPAH